MQSRNVTLLGFLYLPGIIDSLTREGKFEKKNVVVPLFALLNLTFSLFFILRFQILVKSLFSTGKERIAYEYLDNETLDLLCRFDNSLKTGNNIFYLPAQEPSLELTRNRCIGNEDFLRMLELDEVEHKAMHYMGRVDNLIILMPKEFTTRDKGVLKLFRDYKEFEQVGETKKYRFLRGK